MKFTEEFHITMDWWKSADCSGLLGLPDVKSLARDSIKTGSAYTIRIDRDGITLTKHSPEQIEFKPDTKSELAGAELTLRHVQRASSDGSPAIPPVAKKRGRGRPRKHVAAEAAK